MLPRGVRAMSAWLIRAAVVLLIIAVPLWREL